MPGVTANWFSARDFVFKQVKEAAVVTEIAVLALWTSYQNLLCAQ